MAATTITSVAGFTVIPVLYSSDTSHIIYAREHTNSSKSDSPAFPDSRTLFLVNVPPDATEREITQFFKYCGTVERVEFERRDLQEIDQHGESSEGEDEDIQEDLDTTEQPRKRRKGHKTHPPRVVPLPTAQVRLLRRTGQNCHVVFLDSSSLQPALSQPQKARPWPTDTDVPSGFAHYTALYDSLRPPLDIVREHAYTAVALYQYQVDSKKQKSKYRKGEAIVDEDGFTLVTRGGAYGKTLGGGVGVAKRGSHAQRPRKKAKKDKEGLYAFQIHEKNRKKTLDLQARFKQDVERIEKQRTERKFKPY